jgi:hypothetical protein
MNKTTYDRAQFEFVEAMLDERFGPLPERCVERLREMTPKELRDLALRIGAATSLAELGLADG